MDLFWDLRINSRESVTLIVSHWSTILVCCLLAIHTSILQLSNPLPSRPDVQWNIKTPGSGVSLPGFKL